MKYAKQNGLERSAARTGLPIALACMATMSALHAQQVFVEDFEGLPLGPNQEEALAGAHVWTRTAPTGWTVDRSKIPGVNAPGTDGVTEWAGWSFANKDWWVKAAGNQRRVEFTLGRGTVMIADPDEWDDATHTQGLFESTITTPVIGITNAPANSLVLVYDSSWRPEALDDGLPNFPVDDSGTPINNQTAFITAAYDGGAEADIQRWSSVNSDENFHDHLPNESVVIALDNPAGAKHLVLKFGMEKAANDWWWAVDNVAVGIPPFLGGISADGVSFYLRIVEALGRSVDQTKPLSVSLDGTVLTGITPYSEGSYLVVSYSQTPSVFQPGSRHEVRVSYTAKDGGKRDETTAFVAPSYATATATPTSVTATLTETEWLTVDEAKGIQLELDGSPVTATSIQRAETTVVVTYKQTAIFDSNSSHVLKLTYKTSANQALTESLAFNAPVWTTLPASLATAAGTGSQPGMKWRTHQLDASRGTTIAAAEAELAGTLGASVHDTSGFEADGTFLIDYVNLDQNAGDAGHFTASATSPEDVGDAAIPGIPGTTGSTDNIAGEARTFIEFTQTGLYTMVVNSDDGFQVSAGTTNKPTQVVLGAYDSGRGSDDTQFYFKVVKPGVYFLRLLWFEGGGDANVEWFTVNGDGSRALVGGTQPGSLKAYRTRTVAEPVEASNITAWSVADGKLMIQYTGTLKASSTVTGPFLPVSGASSPYSVTPSNAGMFFIAQ